MQFAVATVNAHAAWWGIGAGILAGAIQGLFFHRDDWLGGYTSWPRRMTRLGHISFFGLAFINLAFVIAANGATPPIANANPAVSLASKLIILGTVTMPAVCYLAAFQKSARHLFVIPVGSLFVATAVTLWELAHP